MRLRVQPAVGEIEPAVARFGGGVKCPVISAIDGFRPRFGVPGIMF